MKKKAEEKVTQSTDTLPAIAQKTICVIVSTGLFGITRKLSTGSIEVDAEKQMIRANKKLFESEERAAIVRHNGELRRWLYAHALPGNIFKEGTYVIRLQDLEKVEAKCFEHYQKLQELIEAFVAVYPQKIEDARKTLRSLFDPNDYPSTAVVRAAFTMDWRYVEFKVPGQIEGMNQEIFRRETEKVRKDWEEYISAARDAVTEEFAQLLDHAGDRLAGKNEDDKPKVFRASMLDNIREFFESFESRADVLDLKKLAPMVERAKRLIEGVDTDTLRKNEAVRDVVARGFGELREKVDTLMVDRPKRALSFTEVA